MHIAIPFENGHVEYCDDFIIEEVAEDSIAITVEEISFSQLKAKTRRLAETIIEMISEDYDNEDIKSYIEQHLIIDNK